MPSGAPSRASFEASSNGNGNGNTNPPTKSFTKMIKSSVHGTLRAAGLAAGTPTSRQNLPPQLNNNDCTPHVVVAAVAATTDTDRKRDESRTARGLRKLEDGMNFVRSRRISLLRTSQPPHPPQPQPQPPPPVTASVGAGASAGIVLNNDAGIGWAPFASPSLRKASMSSPDLLTSTVSTDSPAPRSTHYNRAGQQQQRQRQQRPPPINTRAREPQPPISRPRPLIPASSSSTSLPYSPDTPTRRNPSRNPPQTPARKPAHSPPPSTPIPVMRIPSASASTSQLPQFSPSSSRHPVYQASPAHYRSTSSTSLLSSPYRESIRKASSLLVRELARPPQGIKPRDWDDVDIRIRSLVRLERVWGKSGAGASSTAVATSSTMGGSEDRERRLFCETVRDGYVLCM